MQQSKIQSFFKTLNPKSEIPSSPDPDQMDKWKLTGCRNQEPLVTYNRRSSDSGPKSNGLEDKVDGIPVKGSSKSDSISKDLTKKRSYAQYHLELGQSDFLLHRCSVCGIMYARGEEADEKVHKAFHKDYIEGVQFKGWRSERVVSTLGSNKDRILLVLNDDPPAQKQKINQVVKMMENELGFTDHRVIHKLCKVYMFISCHRVVGCLVAEPIRTAHRVVSSPSTNERRGSNAKVSSNDSKPKSTILQFGKISFQREVAKRVGTFDNQTVNECDTGALLCEEEALPAICGFKAVWVAPSKRRKQIASQLLNAARETFLEGRILRVSECAFSPPTSSGKALASSYCRSQSFLIYKEDDI